jgi:FkbM family methyltransferase
MIIVDLHGNLVNIEHIEKVEQDLANKYILEDDIVLELGARYGSVSCTINSKLKNKYNQVVVEPDERVWNALEKNKNSNNCEFNIVKGFISNKKLDLTNLDCWLGGYGATFIENNNTLIPSYSLNEIKQKYKLNFNVLVADCEGFLEVFFDENPDFYDNLRLLIFEEDYPDKCNYDKIKKKLIEKKFNKILEGHQNVWIK